MRIENDVKLDFDDVLIRPKRSEAPSRKSVWLERDFVTLHSKQKLSLIPILAANMDTVGTIAMAYSLHASSLGCCLHKFYPQQTLSIFFSEKKSSLSFYTLGMREDDFEKLASVNKITPVNRICLDVANGYSKYFSNTVTKMRLAYPKAIIMAGNVCTPDMVQELLLGGADIVKIGIGPGSHCSTRVMTGCGYPQLSSIIECADAAHGLSGLVCADGGCKQPADIVKAFGAGADFVMLGGMLAGADECEGDWLGDGLKVYGMSSREAQTRYYSQVPEYATPEGRCSIVPPKGPVSGLVREILGGLRSACSYVGAGRLKDLSRCTTFVRLS